MPISDFSRVSSNNKAALKNVRGVTLIEMIIVVGITTVLLTILIGYSRETAKNLTLINNEAKLVSLFHRAKALSQTFSLKPPLGYDICGYGIHAVKDVDDEYTGEFFIFQDLVNLVLLETCEDDADDAYTPDTPPLDPERLTGNINNFILEPDYLEMVQYPGASPYDYENDPLQDLVFIPPDPTTIINGDEAVQIAEVLIKIKNSPSSFKIRLNNFGQITTE